jgi:DNA-binding transcriptional ArsR family regulator
MTDPEPTPVSDHTSATPRELDLASLKALAHPLRVQIFDALSTYGSFTASGLAERLGESSGATSYHLRQLERHGFVREVNGKGTSRERWWERLPGSFTIGTEATAATPAGRSAADVVFRELRYREEQLLTDYVLRSHDELSLEWRDASSVTTMNTRLTTEQLATLSREVERIVDGYVRENRNQRTPGARPVHLTFNAFPVIDGDVSPGPDRSTNR